MRSAIEVRESCSASMRVRRSSRRAMARLRRTMTKSVTAACTRYQRSGSYFGEDILQEAPPRYHVVLLRWMIDEPRRIPVDFLFASSSSFMLAEDLYEVKAGEEAADMMYMYISSQRMPLATLLCKLCRR
jgi:hypothetical protein